MNVVNISNDKTLVGGPGVGDAIARHRRYGEFVDRLDIIVYSHKSDKLAEFPISGKVSGYPSDSLSKLFFFRDALKIFKRINKAHPVDLVICQDPFVFGLIGVWLKRKYGVKLEINFHGDHWENPYWLKERLLNYLFLLISKYTVPRADGIRVVSRFIKDKLVRHGISANRICVIPTPVDLEKFKTCNEAEVEKIKEECGGKKIVLFVGRLDPIKNLPMLVRAFARARTEDGRACLLIVGEGPERPRLETLVRELGLAGEVVFASAIGQDRIVNYYKAADVFALVSFSEGMPKVLKEAAASGLPLIATKVSGAVDLIKDGVNGYLIDNNNENTLAEKLTVLLADDGMRTAMGERSRELAGEMAADTTPELVRFWQDVISGL